MATAAPPSSTLSNLANLLPTGTVLVFKALIPSFSNSGKCVLANKYLTIALIFCCSLTCFLSSFTDSFLGNDGKLYYGIATPSGLYIFNDDPNDGLNLGKDERMRKELRKYRLSFTDFVHAFVSFVVFLVVSFSSLDVQRCFFLKEGTNLEELFKYLPLGVGAFASALFTIFPTRRRGIGYGDVARGAGTGAVEEKELKKQETVNGKGKERGGVHENEWETKGNNGPSRTSIELASVSHVNDRVEDIS
ncbi:hypothetical protein SLEP1_g30688 [Rubroshorea leprosula]|uniref:Uncharacterized protein n=1 Tax=Rubroshorea leprosula TaxID=152421 RepID=A0AAV5K0Y1_9ROSI|nr:hypothetical protein SLEP1_g30688 [Rubroshorea leprosula]